MNNRLRTPTESQKAHWKIVGKYFGYPQCCVDYFLSGQRDTCGIHGFIPCEHHFKLIRDKKLKLSDLMKDRICILPFPCKHNKDEYELYDDYLRKAKNS
jgi:hypothetical protein